jgi:pantetheine-phosphate adenylyltransferase
MCMLYWIALAVVALSSYAALALIVPILWPRIHVYPWRLPSAYRQKQREKARTVVLAGSYNPPHRGHFSMIAHLSERYGTVIVVVGRNDNKTYAVMPEDRAALLRTMLKSLPNVRVQVVSGYIWRFAKQQNVRVFYRGIRSWEKDGHDERRLQILNTWGPLLLGPLWWPIPTRFLEGKPEYNHISSTLIRDICSKPDFSVQDIHGLVPQCVAEQVVKFYGPKQ